MSYTQTTSNFGIGLVFYTNADPLPGENQVHPVAFDEVANPTSADRHLAKERSQDIQPRFDHTLYADYMRSQILQITARKEEKWAKLPMMFESLRLWNVFIETLPLSWDNKVDLKKAATHLRSICEKNRTNWHKRSRIEEGVRASFRDRLIEFPLMPELLRKLLREVHAVCIILQLNNSEIKTLSRSCDLLFLRKGTEELLQVLNNDASRELLQRIKQRPSYDVQVIEDNLRAARAILQQDHTKLPETTQELMQLLLMDETENIEIILHQLERWGVMLYDAYFQAQLLKYKNSSFLNEEEGILKSAWTR